MKMKKSQSVVLGIVLSIVLLSPLQVHAAGSGGEKKIKNVLILTDGNVRVEGVGGAWSNPDGCGSSASFMIAPFMPGYKAMLASLLSAQVSGFKIRLWFSGCLNWGATTYPKAFSIVYITS
jgi:hypothetical protein